MRKALVGFAILMMVAAIPAFADYSGSTREGWDFGSYQFNSNNLLENFGINLPSFPSGTFGGGTQFPVMQNSLTSLLTQFSGFGTGSLSNFVDQYNDCLKDPRVATPEPGFLSSFAMQLSAVFALAFVAIRRRKAYSES